MPAKSFPALLQAFFTDRMMRQRNASPHTIAAYRDTFRLLLRYAQERFEKAPHKIQLEDLDAPFVCEFLGHLEKTRGICATSRNVRLAAIRSFCHYLAFQLPEYAATIQRVLAIPRKRHDRALVEYLTRPETEALLAAPDRTTWGGRRDHTLLHLAVQTGLRVSELVGLRCQDLSLGTGAHVRCHGKGRKERCTPLKKESIALMRAWCSERNGTGDQPLFPNARGGSLSPDGVQYLLAKHVAAARKNCHSLCKKRVSPHVLRHTAAMDLLQAGVDLALIALWLGHESVETTQIYLTADMAMKEKVLALTTPLNTPHGRYRPDDDLMAFLRGL